MPLLHCAWHVGMKEVRLHGKDPINENYPPEACGVIFRTLKVIPQKKDFHLSPRMVSQRPSIMACCVFINRDSLCSYSMKQTNISVKHLYHLHGLESFHDQQITPENEILHSTTLWLLGLHLHTYSFQAAHTKNILLHAIILLWRGGL